MKPKKKTGHRVKPKRAATPRYMWIALYIGNENNRENRILNGEAWASEAWAKEWVADEGKDYQHDYRIVRYVVSPRSPRAKENAK